jgi:plastocyanin
MATIMDMLNQGLGGLNTPLGQLGTSLLGQSGPQQGNPSGGARLGQAFANMSELQRAQALQQYRNQQIQLGEQQQAMALAQQKAKTEQQQRLQQAMQDPNFLASLGPMAKQMAQLGVDPGELIRAQNADNLASHRTAAQQQSEAHFQAQMAARNAGGGGGGNPPGPKAPTPRQILELPLGDGWMQKQLFDPATNSYKPYGQKYRQFAPGKADPMADMLNQLTPDDNVGAGPAVPGLPGSNASSTPPPSGAGLLMHGAGSNPMARKPAAVAAPASPSNSTADAILSGITPQSGEQMANSILGSVTPKYATPPKASAPPASRPPQYPGAPAVGTVVKGFKFLGGNPADPNSWSKQ